MHAVAEAARKVACTGATPVAATNCLNFGNPEKPEIMAQLSAAIDGIGEACTALGTPITGGNVSLYNETKGEGIYPTPVIGIVGIIDDVIEGRARAISQLVGECYKYIQRSLMGSKSAGIDRTEDRGRSAIEPYRRRYKELGSLSIAKSCLAGNSGELRPRLDRWSGKLSDSRRVQQTPG